MAKTDRRVLMLVGDAMAGKSRTFTEALRHNPVLAAWPLLKPHHHADLRKVLGLALGIGVVWLDDVNSYTTGLDGAVRTLAGTPGVIVAATLRTDQLQLMQDSADLRATWDILTDDKFVEQLTLQSGWSADEQASLAGTEPLIREAVGRGRPLGEVLGAADELRKRLMLGSPRQKALVFTVTDWPRTGLPAQIAEDRAQRLWLAHLPPAEATDLHEMAEDDIERAFHEARSWACGKIAGTTALLRRTKHGLLAEGYLIGLRTTDHSPIPRPIWEEALATAASSDEEDADSTLSALGYHAAASGEFDVALQAWTPVAEGQTDLAPNAAFNIGHLLAEQKDYAGAREYYQRTIDSTHGFGGVDCGRLPRERPVRTGGLRRPAGALPAGHRLGRPGPGTASNGQPRAPAGRAEGLRPRAGIRPGCRHRLGPPLRCRPRNGRPRVLLAEQEDYARAREYYQRAIDSGHSDAAGNAMIRLGVLLAEQEDYAGAREYYQRAIDSGDSDAAGDAMIRLGDLLAEQEDVRAREYYQRAIDWATRS